MSKECSVEQGGYECDWHRQFDRASKEIATLRADLAEKTAWIDEAVRSCAERKCSLRDRQLKEECEQNEKLLGELERCLGAMAYAIGRLDTDSDGCPQTEELPDELRKLADERAGWIEAAVEYHKQSDPVLASCALATVKHRPKYELSWVDTVAYEKWLAARSEGE